MSTLNESKAFVTKTAIAMAGPVDSGKSSFVGVCTTGVLDDGRGSARATVAKHKHEIDAGKTSDISTRILKLEGGKALTFIDLCGHEKYLKTTARGISGHFPDYGCIIVSPQREVTIVTPQHYKLLLSQNIPVFIIISRVDVTLEASYKSTREKITKLLRTGGQKPEFVNGYKHYMALGSDKFTDDEYREKKNKDIATITENLMLNKRGKQATVPVITVSNVDGYYIDVCKAVMNKLEPRDIWNQDSNNNRIVKIFLDKLKLNHSDINTKFSGSKFHVDTAFNVDGIGLVVSGILMGEPVKTGDLLNIGPFGSDFVQVKIRSMHNNNRESVSVLEDHGRGCLNITFPKKNTIQIKKSNIRKGIVLVTQDQVPNICFRFKAAIFIFDKSVSIKPYYSPVINIGTVCQSARVLEDDTFTEEVVDSVNGGNRVVKKVMGPGDIAAMWFKFRQRPEHVIPGSILTFRSGEIHGVGIVLETLPIGQDDDAKPDETKKKNRIGNAGKAPININYKKVDISI
jgi:elongation factor 1-alpha